MIEATIIDHITGLIPGTWIYINGHIHHKDDQYASIYAYLADTEFHIAPAPHRQQDTTIINIDEPDSIDRINQAIQTAVKQMLEQRQLQRQVTAHNATMRTLLFLLFIASVVVTIMSFRGWLAFPIWLLILCNAERLQILLATGSIKKAWTKMRTIYWGTTISPD